MVTNATKNNSILLPFDQNSVKAAFSPSNFIRLLRLRGIVFFKFIYLFIYLLNSWQNVTNMDDENINEEEMKTEV